MQSMPISQNFLPSEAIVDGKSFYDHDGKKQLDATETKLYEYMKGFRSMLVTQGIILTPEELRSIQTAAALIDTLTKARLTPVPESFCSPVLESWHHVFNVFYKARGSDTWKLQFANASYLEKMGANLPDKIQASEVDLMEHLYKPETIERFNAAAKDLGEGYKARFIEMDNVTMGDNEDVPAFFWYRKEFDHPDGGKIQVRIGMNGTGLSLEQRTELADAYKLADILRTQDMDLVHYSNPSYGSLINRIKNELEVILGDKREDKKQLILPLDWMRMILQIADDIVKNSPFPLTIVDKKGIVEQMSPAYAAMIGYTVHNILKPGFFDKIYPGVEGSIVKQSIIFYGEHGYYPEDASFIVSRGSMFRSLEEQHDLHSLKSLELIPFPYPINERVVPVKIIDIIGETITRDNLSKIINKILINISEGTVGIDKAEWITDKIITKLSDSVTWKYIEIIIDIFTEVFINIEAIVLTEIIEKIIFTETIDVIVNDGTIRLNTAQPLEKSLLDLVPATWQGNCYFQTEEPNEISNVNGDLAEWLLKNS